MRLKLCFNADLQKLVLEENTRVLDQKVAVVPTKRAYTHVKECRYREMDDSCRREVYISKEHCGSATKPMRKCVKMLSY